MRDSSSQAVGLLLCDLPPELLSRIAWEVHRLSPNSVPTGFKLSCRSVATALQGQATLSRVLLRHAVPQHEFARRWREPSTASAKPLNERRRLINNVACSGSLENLQLVLTSAGRRALKS
jgi:hypothetical protein